MPKNLIISAAVSFLVLACKALPAHPGLALHFAGEAETFLRLAAVQSPAVAAHSLDGAAVGAQAGGQAEPSRLAHTILALCVDGRFSNENVFACREFSVIISVSFFLILSFL